MTNVPARSAGRAADARRAWVIGGALLIATAVLPLSGSALGPFFPFSSLVWDLAWCSALVLFAFGIRGAGSVVGRRPGGVLALVVAGVTPVVFDLFWTFAPRADAPADWMMVAGYLEMLVTAIALAVATVMIARAGAVPDRVRWMPLIALAAVVGVQVLIQLVATTAPALGDQVALPFILAANLVVTGSLVAIGVLAIVFAPKADASGGAVQVYPPTS